MQTPKSPVQVKQVVFHKQKDHDEVVAYTLLRQYGVTYFPGIDTACVRYSQETFKGTDAQYDALHILPIGCGQGRFDEHRDTGRVEGETATTLAAKYLGIEDNPELKRLLSETLECDTQKGTSPTQLASIIKAANHCNKQDATSPVLTWAMKGIRSIIHQEMFKFVPVASEKTLAQIFQSQQDEGLCDDDSKKIRETLSRYVEQSMKQKDKKVTELAHIVECLYREGYAEAAVNEWVEFALYSLRNEQVEFREQVKLFRKKRMVFIYAPLPGRHSDLKLRVCCSDSVLAQKAARFAAADLILLVKSSGHRLIFTDARIPGLSLKNAIRMIRWLEVPLDKKKKFTWEELGCEGTHPEIPEWYYFKSAETAFNSSETHDAPPTKICPQGLIEVLENAFDDELVEKWCRYRGIDIPQNDESLDEQPVLTC